jgi:mannose-6-phosphate isomerase-like protein (cupin superfamily)
LEELRFEPHSIAFFENSLAACLHGTSLQAAAFLSFGTEGIVPELYRIFTKGLLAAGLSEEALQFFMIHVECDDDHAQTLQDMAFFYVEAPDWYEICELAMVQALDIRDRFFSSVFQTLRPKAFDDLVRRMALPSGTEDEVAQPNVCSVRRQNTPLYRNTDSHQGIMFEVERIAVGADVLDPRVLTIPAGRRNESHRHAHETLMLVLSGRGEVYLGETSTVVTRDDVVLVPRWVPHHTRNTGSDDLRILAITDFELTSRFPGNTEESYRAR